METPNNPFGLYDEAAIGLHEMYLCYINVGFTPDQAFKLVLVHLQGAVLSR